MVEATYTASQVARMLRYLGESRRDYFHGKNPEHAGDFQKLGAQDWTALVILSEAETADRLANYFETPAGVWGWLPTWRMSGWEELIAEIEKERTDGLTGGQELPQSEGDGGGPGARRA